MSMNVTISLQRPKTKENYKEFTNTGSADNFNRFFQIGKVKKYRKLIGISKISRKIFVLCWSNTEKKV